MQAITTIGLDIAKSVFQIHGVDADGQVVIRRQLKRRLRDGAAAAVCCCDTRARSIAHQWCYAGIGIPCGPEGALNTAALEPATSLGASFGIAISPHNPPTVSPPRASLAPAHFCGPFHAPGAASLCLTGNQAICYHSRCSSFNWRT
jgi:hypothetical protein